MPTGFFIQTPVGPIGTKRQLSEFVYNLSKYELSADELSLLEKGLSFIPTARGYPKADVKQSLEKQQRKLRLKNYFQDDGTLKEPKTVKEIFKYPSRWEPSYETPMDKEVKECLVGLDRDVWNEFNATSAWARDTLRIPSKDNLTRGERNAIKTLRSNPNIIIKPADKGGAVVIMNVDDYEAEGLRQLQNTKYYEELDGPVYPETAKKLTEVLSKMLREGFITEDNFDYLKPSANDKKRYFYLLPKVHKDPSSWKNPNMPEGRPIVSNCDSECARICKYIEYWLRPLANRHKSYVKDTYDFLNKIRGRDIGIDDYIVTADVSALYTNMNIERTLRIVKIALKRTAGLFPNRPDDYLLELLALTLRWNDFEFNGKWYLQKWGTAMGKDYAPSLADLFLEYFDERAMAYHVTPRHYFRFLDDVFFVFSGTRGQLSEFNGYLNGLINSISVELTPHSFAAEFLDTFIYKSIEGDKCILRSRVYFKPVDTHQLLHAHSFHPKHTCKGIVKSQLIRFKRICSTKSEYDWACQVLFPILGKRGYNERALRDAKSDIWNNYNHLTASRKKVSREAQQEIWPIVVHSNRIGNRLAMKWRSRLSKLELLKNVKIITAYRIHSNLRKLLIRGRFERPSTALRAE